MVTPPLGRLHLVTPPSGDPLPALGAALAAAPPGALTVQVRVDDAVTDREAYQLALRTATLCARYGVACLVNDRLDVALAAGADGAHVGADDLPVEAARRVLGPHAILGGTARDPSTAAAAVRAGADYVGVGPAYVSTTKSGLPEPIGPAGVGAVARALDRPVVAIGGVVAPRVPDLVASGAFGVAVIGAVFSAADPARAVSDLLRALDAGTPRSVPAASVDAGGRP